MTANHRQAGEFHLRTLFESKNVRILGTTEDPLFCASDVAGYLHDTNQSRMFAKYTASHLVHIEIADSEGRLRRTPFLTESGLYKYLIQSRLPRAEEFQEYVFTILKRERSKVVDEAKLRDQIAHTKVQCQQRMLDALRGQLATERQQRLYIEAEHAADHELLERSLTVANDARLAMSAPLGIPLSSPGADPRGLFDYSEKDPL